MSTTNSALSALADLMKSEDFSDLTFSCNEEKFKVHKCVVCGQSPVIKAALSGNFEEGRTNVIPMDAFDAETVRRLVQFFYTGDYDHPEVAYEDADDEAGEASVKEDVPDAEGMAHRLHFSDSSTALPESESQTIASVDSLNIHIKVNSIGDYYGVTKLMSLANDKIKHLIQQEHERDDSGWVANIPAATALAYSSTGDDELLAILAAEIAKNLSALTLSRDFENLDGVSDLAFKVFQACAKEIQDLTMQVNRLAADKVDLKVEMAAKLRDSALLLARSEEAADKMRKCFDVLRETDRCRNCRDPFGCTVWEDEYILLCSRCRSEH
ncbi:hypothetical protein CP532_6866 [Ophiocordyceps camponoti-leonardi (nom. inval.)]|nr:hypothetical protein CP532_6866 [Ophiocordyceps camponoti-leonardi (nom. inval.)]